MFGDLSFYNSSLNLAVLVVCTDRKTKLINTQHYSPIKASKTSKSPTEDINIYAYVCKSTQLVLQVLERVARNAVTLGGAYD